MDTLDQKTKRVTVVTIEAQFAELKGGAAYQTGRGRGTTVKAAGARAFTDLLKQPKLRRKHFSSFTAVVTVGRIEEPIT